MPYLEDRGFPSHTNFLNRLLVALQRADIITTDKSFLTFIGFTINKKNIDNLSNWKNEKTKTISNQAFLHAIETKCHFKSDIWKQTELLQNKAIETFIANFYTDTKILDINEIIPSHASILPIQQKALEQFEIQKTQYELETDIATFLEKGWLEKTLENQEFLIALFKKSYDKGLYTIMLTFIFPSLFHYHQCDITIKKLEAHAQGSLGNYDEATRILQHLTHSHTIEHTNLRTSAISNYKRQLFNNPQKSPNKEQVSTLIFAYQTLHQEHNLYSYYTGINLLYIVQLAKLLYPDEKAFATIDTQEIYDKSKPSLKTDKTHHDYYVTMSAFEFKILLGNTQINAQIESFLDNQKPHPSLVERTLRQMQLFVDFTYESNHEVVTIFKTIIKILEAYSDALTT